MLKRIKERAERQLKALDFGGVQPDDTDEDEDDEESTDGDEDGGDAEAVEATSDEDADADAGASEEGEEGEEDVEGEDDLGGLLDEETGEGEEVAAEAFGEAAPPPADPRDQLIQTMQGMLQQMSESMQARDQTLTGIVNRLTNSIEMLHGMLGEETDPVIDRDNDGQDDVTEQELAGRYSARQLARMVLKGYMSRRCKGCVKEAADYLAHVADKDDLPLAYKSGHRYHAKELAATIADAAELDDNEDERQDDRTAAKKDFEDALAILTPLSQQLSGLEQRLYSATGRR